MNFQRDRSKSWLFSIGICALGSTVITIAIIAAHFQIRRGVKKYRRLQKNASVSVRESAYEESNSSSFCDEFSADWSRSRREVHQDECGTIEVYPCMNSGLCISMNMDQKNWNPSKCDEKWSRRNLTATNERDKSGSPRIEHNQLGRRRRRPIQGYLSMSKTSSGLVRSVARYESSLKCAPGRTRKGNVVLTFPNFRQKNIWHSMASFATVRFLAKVIGLKFDTVRDWQAGSSKFFRSGNLHWHYGNIFLNDMPHTARPTSCFERVVFFEELERKWQGSWWGFLYKDTGKCDPVDASNPIVSPVSSVRQSFLSLQNETLDELGIRPLENKGKVHLCYMFRSHQTNRHFDASTDEEVDNMLIRWSQRNEGRSVFKANFSSATQKLTQITEMSKCDIMFGLHGAGLTHMLWKKSSRQKPSLAVLEISHRKKCLPFYRKLAWALGHDYICYSDLGGSSPFKKESNILNLNISLIDRTLESLSHKATK